MLTRIGGADEVETNLRGHQRTPGEVALLAATVPPFSYEEWQRESPPATPEELADWEEFLRERDEEREANLARESGVDAAP
jgi:hypothetical protein